MKLDLRKFSISFFLIHVLNVGLITNLYSEPLCSNDKAHCWSQGVDFFGTIAQFPIQLKLVREGEKLEGYYFYESTARYLMLEGKIDAKGNSHLKEYDNSKVTAEFRGQWQENKLMGTWKKAGASQKLSFTLQRNQQSFAGYSGSFQCEIEEPKNNFYNQFNLKIQDSKVTLFEEKVVMGENAHDCEVNLEDLQQGQSSPFIVLRGRESKGFEVRIHRLKDFLRVDFGREDSPCGLNVYTHDLLIHSKTKECKVIW